MYHLCHELGRFPHELPTDLPDEQLTLMFAYLELRAELRESGSRSDALVRQGRAAEVELQQMERAAWAERKEVNRG